MANQVTLEDVAARANVSRATVSRVINAPNTVSKAALERTLKAITELNYSPNRHARALTGQRTQTIGLIFFEEVQSLFGTPFWGQIVNPIYENLVKEGFECNLIAQGSFNHNGIGESSIRFYANFLNSRNVDGFILIGQPSQEFEASFAHSHIPMIMFGRPSIEDSEIVYVDSDNQNGAIAAIEHLAKQKKRTKIAMITGSMHMIASQSRFNGYKKGLAKVGMTFDIDLVEHGNFTLNSGREAMTELLKRRPDIDGVFVANDEMAQGAIDICRNRKLSIPRDISIVGFDNTSLSALTIPPLTTMAHDYERLGKELVNAVIKELQGSRPSSKVVPVKLVVRESS